MRVPPGAVNALQVFLLTVLVASCGGDGGTEPPPALVPTGASSSGDGQTALAGTVLPTSITVIISDQNGNVLAGVTITWAATTGGGSVNPASSTTGVDGSASTTWTLGTTAGQQTVTATIPNLSPLVFTATAVAGDPAGVSVTPATVNLNAFGATSQLSAQLVDANGNAVAGGTFTWMTSDGTLASVDVTGLVTAVANGNATITATSDALSGTAAVVVQQVAAAVAVTPAAPTVAIGLTQQLTATVSDANGNAIAGAEVGWTSSDATVATVSATGLATGVAEGTATITATSGNATGTSAVTVILVPQPFEPTGDQDVGGTLNVAEVMIPAGVTITATGPLTINASGNVQIDGAIMGDCVPITVNGSATVVVTGVVNNDCAGLVGEESPGLTIVGGGTVTFDGAVLTSTGDITLGNDLAALASLGAVLSPALLGNSTAQTNDAT